MQRHTMLQINARRISLTEGKRQPPEPYFLRLFTLGHGFYAPFPLPDATPRQKPPHNIRICYAPFPLPDATLHQKLPHNTRICYAPFPLPDATLHQKLPHNIRICYAYVSAADVFCAACSQGDTDATASWAHKAPSFFGLVSVALGYAWVLMKCVLFSFCRLIFFCLKQKNNMQHAILTICNNV